MCPHSVTSILAALWFTGSLTGGRACNGARAEVSTCEQNDSAPPTQEPWRNAIPTPFQHQLSLSLGGRENSATFAVPEGKLLVIEYVSVGGEVPFGQRLLVALETSVNGESAKHFLVSAWPNASWETTTDGDVVRLRQWLRVYADGGTKVKADISRTGAWGGGSASVTVTGYLVGDLRTFCRKGRDQ